MPDEITLPETAEEFEAAIEAAVDEALTVAGEEFAKREEEHEAEIDAAIAKAFEDAGVDVTPVIKMDDLPDEVRKALEDGEASKTEIAKLRDEQRVERYVGIAKSLPFVAVKLTDEVAIAKSEDGKVEHEGAAESFGALLARVAKSADEKDMAALVETFEVAQARLAQSDIFKSTGSDGGTAAGEAKVEFEQRVEKRLTDAKPGELTVQQARLAVAREDTDLYKRMTEEESAR